VARGTTVYYRNGLVVGEWSRRHRRVWQDTKKRHSRSHGAWVAVSANSRPRYACTWPAPTPAKRP